MDLFLAVTAGVLVGGIALYVLVAASWRAVLSETGRDLACGVLLLAFVIGIYLALGAAG